MKPTKKFILERALHLFNENGFVNVRLQHIADGASVSVGHLAYHFKNKDAIITTLYHQINKKQDELLTACRVLPLFEDIDFMLRELFVLQEHYKFFYLDTLEVMRAFPEIEKEHQALLSMQRQQILFMFDFNTSRAAFLAPKYEDQFADLSHIFCLSMDSWLSYQYVNGNKNPVVTEYCRDLWSLLSPVFSDTGFLEYGQLRNDGIFNY